MLKRIAVLEVIKTLERLIEPTAENAGQVVWRSRLRAKLGLHEKALADFTLAVQLAPSLSSAYFHRSLTYVALDDQDHALADIE